MLIYLAGPITAMDDSGYPESVKREVIAARIGIANELNLRGHVVYQPHLAFRGTSVRAFDQERSATRINIAAVERADVLVAIVHPGMVSHGTDNEIRLARAHRIEVIQASAPRLDVLEVANLVEQAGVRAGLGPQAGPQPVDEFETNSVALLPQEWLGKGAHVPGTFADAAPQGRGLHFQATGPVGAVSDDLWPRKTYESDAGFDLIAQRNVTIPRGGGVVRVPTGIRAALPPGTFGWIVARSSMSMRGLLVLPGIVDAGYRGPLDVIVTALPMDGESSVRIKRGERVGQLIVIPDAMAGKMITAHTPESEEFPSGDRGLNGYGSSGR